jgi:hypothetical protein
MAEGVLTNELAYVETPARGITLNEPDDIQTLSDRYDIIRAHALSVAQSREHIRRVLAKKWT